jgi:predicted ABC-type ATPase
MKNNKLDYSDFYAEGGKVDRAIPLSIRKQIFDADGERRIDSEAIEVLTNYAENLPQTKDLNTSKTTGQYYPERQKLHKKIMDSFKQDLICIQNDEPIAILMGGSPASGKSTFLRKYAPYLLKEEILKVDADEIRAKLPEYKGWNATSTHLETKDIVNTLLSDRTIGIPCKYDVIYDGTMNSTKSYLPLIALLRKLGYKIFIVYIDKVEEEVVKKRALERYKKSGRFVPMAVIDDFFTRGKSALNELKDKADGYMVVDGSGGDYNVIERGGMKLPKRRAYSKLGVPIAKLEKESKMEDGGMTEGYTPDYLRMFLGK